MPATNTLFALIAADNPEMLGAKIQEKFPHNSLEVKKGQWLVVAPSTTTTTELSGQLGVTDGESGGAIVVSVSSYYGRTNVSIWEWIAAKMGATGNVSQTG